MGSECSKSHLDLTRISLFDFLDQVNLTPGCSDQNLITLYSCNNETIPAKNIKLLKNRGDRFLKRAGSGSGKGFHLKVKVVIKTVYSMANK